MSLEKQEFFAVRERLGEAVTFDDVSIEPGASEYDVNEVDISTQITPGIKLKTPIISAAMDTVTNAEVAIEMAKLGGLGVIHCGLTIEEQKREVRRVKLHLNGLVERPRTVESDQTIEGVLRFREENRFRFDTFPVVGEGDVLVGLLTGDDIKSYAMEPSTRVEDAMRGIGDFPVSVDPNTTIDQALKIMRKEHESQLPLVNEEGRLIGLYTLTDVTRILSSDSARYSVDGDKRLLVAAALPTNPDEALARIDALEQYCDVYFLDTAQGDGKYAYHTVKTIKEQRGVPLIAGNVSVAASTEELIRLGADGIKVGQGDGRTCITRRETGVGVPQISAIYECAVAAKKYGIPVCADGGISDRGNIAKAIAAGAYSVMVGTMIGATSEAPGMVDTDRDGRKSKMIRGMGSAGALRDNSNSRGYDPLGRLPEGVEKIVPIAGSVEEVLNRAIQALKRNMELCGFKDIEDMRARARFILNSNAGMAEARPQILSEF